MKTLCIPSSTPVQAAGLALRAHGYRVDPRIHRDGLHLRLTTGQTSPAARIRAAALRLEVRP